MKCNCGGVSREMKLFALFCLVTIGFGASVAHIYNQRELLISHNNVCPRFDSSTASLVMEKRFFSQWHWRYAFEDSVDGDVRMMCPTTQYDTALYIGGDFAAYIDGKIFSTQTRSHINDCNGNPLFVSETGSTWQTIINGNNILVSYVLRDATNSTNLLAYVEGTHFLTDDINVQAASDGHVIARMKRNTWSTTWRWYIDIDDLTHPAADLRVLALLAGKRSFEDSNVDGNQTTDSCNTYFWVTAWIVVACTCVIVVVVGIVTFFAIRSRCMSCKNYATPVV
jgi:hypothetical protein